MGDIEASIKELFGKISSQIPGGRGMKNLLVVLCAAIGAYLTYKWLKETLGRLLA